VHASAEKPLMELEQGQGITDVDVAVRPRIVARLQQVWNISIAAGRMNERAVI
jgi:hypothetical protein